MNDKDLTKLVDDTLPKTLPKNYRWRIKHGRDGSSTNHFRITLSVQKRFLGIWATVVIREGVWAESSLLIPTHKSLNNSHHLTEFLSELSEHARYLLNLIDPVPPSYRKVSGIYH